MTSTESSSKLAGKTAIVTGGAGGLGKAIATAFLKAGANVAVCDVKEAQLEACSSELSALGNFHTVVTNVADETSVASLFTSCAEKFGSVDILINNAGVMDSFGAAGTMDKKLWDRVIAVNLTGPFLTTKTAVNHFLSTKNGGLIVNIASVAALRGAASGAAYTASKHGLIGLTKNTAAAYSHEKIRCNALLPGGMQTNIGESIKSAGMNAEGFARMEKTAAVGAQPVEIEKVAQMAVYLATDDGSIINGATIAVDNGWSAH